MSSVNKVILVGRLGRAPEIRTFQGGDKIANIALATSEKYTDKQSGQREEKTEWHRVTLHGKLADIAERYLQKGALIYVEGKLQTRKYQAPDGSDRYTTEIHVWHGLQMLSGKTEGQQQGAAQAGQQHRFTAQDYHDVKNGIKPIPTSAPQPANISGVDDMDDDIPF